MFADHPASSSSARIGPGDHLILFTDGVTEALNPLKQEFGDASLVETLLANRKSELSDLVATVFAAVDDFADGEEQADDIACVAIRRARE